MKEDTNVKTRAQRIVETKAQNPKRGSLFFPCLCFVLIGTGDCAISKSDPFHYLIKDCLQACVHMWMRA